MDIASLVLAIGSFIGGGKALKQAFEPKRSGQMGLYEDSAMSVKTYRVGNIQQRIGYITQMIKKGRDNPEVRRRTVQILSQKCGRNKDRWCVPEKNWNAEAKAVFDAVRSRVRYVRDTYGKDLFQHPLRTFEFGGADCDDYSIVLSSMLQSVGYPVKLRIIKTVDSDDWNHIYVLVGLPPQGPSVWMPLDASVDKPAGWEAPASMVAATRDFLVQ